MNPHLLNVGKVEESVITPVLDRCHSVALMVAFPQLFTSIKSSLLRARTLWASLRPDTLHYTQGCDIYARVIYGARAFGFRLCPDDDLRRLDRCNSWPHRRLHRRLIDAVISRTDIFFVALLLAAIVFMQMFKQYRNIWMVILVLSLEIG